MDESEFIFQPIQDELHCRIENLENVIARTDVSCHLDNPLILTPAFRSKLTPQPNLHFSCLIDA